jgi:hypothetical protein
VVWWAIRAEPRPEDYGEEVGVHVPLTPCTWGDGRRRTAAARRRPFRPLPRPPARARTRVPA